MDDPRFASSLANRLNIDLKMNRRDRLTLIRILTLLIKIEQIKEMKVLTPQPAKWRSINISASTSSSGAGSYIRGTSLWYWMIFEALSLTDNANGLDVDAIHSYIGERGDDNTPEPCKRHLRTMLQRLVNHGQIEMNGNRNQIINYEPNNPIDGEKMNNKPKQKKMQQNLRPIEHKEREMMEAIQKENKLDELLET